MGYFTREQVLAKIRPRCMLFRVDDLLLIKGDGYHYFIYDPEGAALTHSVYVCHLNHLPKETWIAEGVEFVKSAQQQISEMLA